MQVKDYDEGVRKVRRRSDCPISNGLDFFGDKWSLLIMRDLLFREKSRYGEFLDSEEGIATNILAERLERLEHTGFIRREPGASLGRQTYAPTDKGKDLIPVLFEILLWSAKHNPETAAPKLLVAELRRDRKRVIQAIRRGGGIERFLRSLN
jgi:DNA-binding HxlR family transcriptional regulator